MTLLEWKDRNNLTYPKIVEHLDGRWSRVWVVNVWTGRNKPSRDMLLAIKKLTGLEDKEILGAEQWLK